MKDAGQEAGKVKSLIGQFSGKDGNLRARSRAELVKIGGPAVPGLCAALRTSPEEQVRWEAAKTLAEIEDPRAISFMVRALKDPDEDVAWIAAEFLRGSGKAAWPALLAAVLKCGPKSFALRKGAHHALWEQRVPGYNKLLAALRRALAPGAPPESAPEAAYKLLEKLRAE